MEIKIQKQISTIQSEVAALISVIRPILEGLLYGLKADVVAEVGGYDRVKLKMLNRLYRQGDGDIGLCFEYAIHNAIKNCNPLITERIEDALRLCNVQGQNLNSLLFAVEKTGKLNLVDSVLQSLTDDSQLMSGSRGRPVKLKRHIMQVASAFRRPTARLALPQSISGLWKADLFIGDNGVDSWVGTSVKVNASDLRAEPGLRVGIVPTRQGRNDRVVKDDTKNIIVCPIPYDDSFMQLFYAGWRIVQQFMAADGNLPNEDRLPLPHEREVARSLAMRRESTVLAVVEVLEAESQRHLIESSTVVPATITTAQTDEPQVADSILAPQPAIDG
ncbi:hypothetical protein [Xanthomonas translucens]|uniref:hypothetical protein n=1 Tax=Xanthomonas campestris pv. translucens TaxID=343 RepID=UPI000AE5BD6B|nr:hypothetical protein [Xanthomonas translucens]QEO27184.1 hypothetical protein F0H32_14100 [Xanthomonas translucens pv. undulosa]